MLNASTRARASSTRATDRHRFGLSLRAKMLAIMASGVVFGIVAALVLLFAVRQADQYLARTSAAERQLERLISLSGRISDYGLKAVEASEPGEALEHGRDRVNAVFRALDAGVGEQVGLVDGDTARNAAATKSLIIARLKAQFDSLHRRIKAQADTGADRDRRAAFTRAAMDAFGVTFAPLLAQALEDERSGARGARDGMAVLRTRMTTFAVLWVLSGTALAFVLYLAAGRPILSRIAETVRGAKAISSGRLDERLAPSGRDELTLLMTRFNRMADNLARREARLLVAQQALKETVAAKTSDLEAANVRLEEIDANRRRFFSDISHELRTPLTVILGEADVSLRQIEAETGTTLRRAFETIHGRANALRRRVDDLLRVARSESGRLDLVMEPCIVNAVIEDAVADVGALSRRLGMSVDFEPSPAIATISADKDWLRQVIAGVLINALKYSPRGSAIRIAARASGESVRIDIRDEGCGIAAADLPHVFDRFYRGQNRPQRDEGGYGVGLALVKWVVSDHDGDITVTSPAEDAGKTGGSAGPGTLVSITLPLLPERNEPESKE